MFDLYNKIWGAIETAAREHEWAIMTELAKVATLFDALHPDVKSRVRELDVTDRRLLRLN